MASTFQSLFKMLAGHEEQHTQQQEDQVPSSIVPEQYQSAGYCNDVSFLSASPVPIQQQQASMLSPSYGCLDTNGYGKTYEMSNNLYMPSNMCASWLPMENDFSLGDVLDDECSWLATPQSHESFLTTPPPPSLTCTSSPCLDDYASSQPSIYSQQHTPQLAWTSSSTSAESSIGSVSCNQSSLYNNGPVNNTTDCTLLCLSPPQSCSTSATTLAQLVNGLSVDASPTPTTSDGMLLQPWLEQQVYAQQQQQPPTPPQPDEQPRAKRGRQTSATKKKPVRRTRHKCPFCFHTSNRANNMKEHIMTHYPDRPKDFKCNLCDKAFARKHDMKRHLKTHERRRKPRYPGTLLFC
ncbi:hypothetical protein O0I10_004561 [Lichtheimia ornata]|uniref:C2H2-type domain-containing protein n=1 Tax=Lichtheimia ornata TaxID=688661 RepID=A0AAD7XWE3_9FUNG|nr:uncharacterized protein O0I10_004561 [Lichtheimia ornata]KAJ8659584.1 hypothetical protein O0I10_004561 [Lichtheimia ornata]